MEMDTIVVIVALCILALVVVGLPYLLVSHARLRARVTALEVELGAGERPLSATAINQEPAPKVASTGPWVRPEPAPTPPPPEAGPAANDPAPPRAFVLNGDRMASLVRWLGENWALAVAGISLALAGVFMVQYGVENGLLTPFWRVMGALALGAALIAGGELIRRRHGDERGATAGLPSVLSGAGVITLFAAVLAARALYGLIGPEATLIALVGVAAVAIGLGWFYGPVLSALGLTGAGAAPFLVGGSSDAPWVFYYYYALLAFVGLAVDAWRRWAWISVLALAVTVGGATLLYLGGAGALHYLAFWALATLFAVLVPERRLTPLHAGNSLSRRIMAGGDFPEFPTRLALAMVALSSAAAVLVAMDAGDVLTIWLSLGLLAAMIAALVLGTSRAPALEDLPVLPALAGLVFVAVEGLESGPLWATFRAGAARLPETPAPLAASVLMLGGAVTSTLFALRMRWSGGVVAMILWALGAALAGPAMALILELWWQPGDVIGGYHWALHVIAMAGLMVWFAMRAAKAQGQEARLHVALFAGAAIVLISLALFVMLSAAALTLALAVMVLVTALIDRRFDLPLLGGVAQLGIAVIGYRLVLDPGLLWAVNRASLSDVILSHAGPLALLGAAWWVMAPRAGHATRVVVESAIWNIAAIFASVLLQRWLGGLGAMGHAGLGLMATVWLVTAMTQLYRLQVGGRIMRVLRVTLAVGAGAIGAILLAAQAVLTNPLMPFMWRKEWVTGPAIFDSLAAAYLPVALVFAMAAWRLGHLPRLLRRVFALFASAYAAWYGALEIRRLWQGRDLSVSGVSDGELYSYTIALIAVSAVLLLLALLRRSETLRRLAMAGVALTVAKVFLVDMAGLAGLVRVASFLGLGLSLAGLAWLNQRIARHMAEPSA
ncbi:Uncharacterized membrane protein [Roseovarius lutimaris]|uniref:Uncharacterized membrane protein n=2 Tax=Roseovarius lutimaris TaxID=1005928 RepID=A0A1I5BMP1_9RHOB|nr:Uncharacterized membrane protein [Roseovarius lutimaris]